MNGHSFVIHVQKTVYQDSPFHTTDCNNHCEANRRITKSREKSHQEAESHKKHDLNIHDPLNGQNFRIRIFLSIFKSFTSHLNMPCGGIRLGIGKLRNKQLAYIIIYMIHLHG